MKTKTIPIIHFIESLKKKNTTPQEVLIHLNQIQADACGMNLEDFHSVLNMVSFLCQQDKNSQIAA